MISRFFSWLASSLTVLLLMNFLSGCRSESDTFENVPVELRVLLPGASPDSPMNQAYNRYFQELGALYSELHPEVTLKIVNFPANSNADQVENLLRSGESPDIVLPLDSSRVPGLLERGDLQDLNRYDKEGTGVKARFYKPLITATESKGKWGLLPVVVLPLAVLYNKTYFDKAQLPYPSGPWSWDDYLEVSKKLAQANPGLYGSGNAYTPHMLEVVMASKNASLLTRGEARAAGAMDSAAAIETVAWFNRYFRELMLKELPDPSNHLTTGTRFNQGAIGMTVTSSDGLAFYQNRLGDKLGVAPLPGSRDGRRANPLQIVGVGIAGQSQHPQEAWEFLRFAFLTEHALTPQWAKWFLITIPGMKAAAEQEKQPAMSVFLEELNYAVSSPAFTNPDWPNLYFGQDRSLFDAFSRLLFTEDVQLPGALHQLAQRTDLALQKEADRRAAAKR